MADPPEKNWLYLITWVGIVTSSTYSFANDKFKLSNEIIVIKIEESLNFVVKIELYGIFEIFEQKFFDIQILIAPLVSSNSTLK